MTYNNIVTLALSIGTVVVRQGGANDWSSYLVGDDGDVQSGSLTKLSAGENDHYGITTAMKEVYPELRYRH